MNSSGGWGRYAPSPTGEFHLGNLRTAVLAWLCAQHTGHSFLVRMEDLDASRVRHGIAQSQVDDLAALGLTWSGPVVYQSQRTDLYRDALADLSSRGLTYECFCTRKEIHAAIAESAGAPHQPVGFYSGTCRNLSTAAANARRAVRPGTVRLRAGTETGVKAGSSIVATITDALHGQYSAAVDDFVLQRGDGGFAYNLAVVVDDAAQNVDQVVRGDDLLESAPRQSYLAKMLALPVPQYVHVPLVLGPGGQRLAKRDGAVTRRQLNDAGWDDAQLLLQIAASLHLNLDLGNHGVRFSDRFSDRLSGPDGDGLATAGAQKTAASPVEILAEMLRVFEVSQLPRAAWTFDPETALKSTH